MASYLTAWEWKTEPESPTCSVLEGSEDVWLFDDDGSKQPKPEDGPQGDEKLSQPTRAQVAAQLLDDLDRYNDEPFSDWLEEKIDLPIFADIPLLDHRSNKLDTVTLLQEFESVCDAVELSNGALTPPQSPPYNTEQYTNSFADPISFYHSEPLLQQLPEKSDAGFRAEPGLVLSDPMAPFTSKPGYTVTYADDMILLDQIPQATPQPDVDMELAVVDELVRIRAEGMDVSLDPWETSNVSSPVDTSESEAMVLSPPDTSNDSFGADPEWIPETVNSPMPAPLKRKRGKPYGRPVEDKRNRKKEQNKNAATRYRQKKKQEVEVILDEEKDLEDRNVSLHEKVTDLQREIKYLKGLMRDMFRAKGLLK